MFDSIPTTAERLSAFAATLAIGAILLLSTAAIVSSKHRLNFTKRTCGLIVCAWVAGSFVVGGTYGAFFGGDKRYLMTFGGYGLIVGPIIGNFHASLLENRMSLHAKPADPETIESSVLESSATENPYEPPRQTMAAS
jgi:hypothetical protein